VAVPWPVQFENTVVHGMMRAVASVAVEIAAWSGVAAYQLGNVIQLRNGFVGVDEACSGVKTLQAGIMVAFVLGELLHLRWSQRIGLVLMGCGWIFLCNVIRATALVFIAATHGLDALHRWHDAIGTVALIGGLGGVILLAWWWKNDLHQVPMIAEQSPAVPAFPSQAVALLWLALAVGANEIWYRSHERKLIERPPWDMAWPHENATFKTLPIPESTRTILHYDAAVSAEWENPPGVRWWAFFAHWKPQRAALQLVRSHSPEICLPAAGRIFQKTQPDVVISSDSFSLDFSSYQFEQNGRPLFVFVCIQEDKRLASSPADSGEWSVRGRLRAAWEGKRNLGQRLLELAVSGVESFTQARDLLAKATPAIVRAETKD
jgi:exosortase/archaeosortase family protein